MEYRLQGKIGASGPTQWPHCWPHSAPLSGASVTQQKRGLQEENTLAPLIGEIARVRAEKLIKTLQLECFLFFRVFFAPYTYVFFKNGANIAKRAYSVIKTGGIAGPTLFLEWGHCGATNHNNIYITYNINIYSFSV